MMEHINILGTFILVIFGYLVGSISPSILISRKKITGDVRNYYSHNAGATNAARVLGKKWGFVILMADGFKPVIIVLIAWSFTLIQIKNPNWAPLFKDAFIYFSGVAAIIGHCYPIFFNFRGGKGAASSLGLLLIINPIYCLVAIATWWFFLFIFKMVSLSSILMLLAPIFFSFIPHFPWNCLLHPQEQQYYLISVMIAIAWIIVILRHYSNIIRIINGTERKVKLFNKNNNQLNQK